MFIYFFFIYNLLHGLIAESRLLGLLNLADPTINSRNHPTFYLSKHKTVYGDFISIDRLLVLCNNITIIDLFYLSGAKIHDSILTNYVCDNT